MIFSSLKKAGILGMNRRLGSYILPENPRKRYPLVDDKVETSRLCLEHNIPTAMNYMVIESFGKLRDISDDLAKLNSFVIKPARGSQGNGILLISSVQKSQNETTPKFLTSKGEKSLRDIQYHISSVLSGLYSLNGFADKTIIQEKLNIHELFRALSPTGIPDIRVIIFRGFPVMAMIRLATEASSGRANLHQGAVGCGIRISDGILTNAVHFNNSVTYHPDTKMHLKGVKIPNWDEVLDLAARCYDITGLGYLGIDVVMDPQKGPLLLEMNARPGLAIQTANLAGLVPRLELIQKEDPSIGYKEKVEKSKTLFPY